MATLKRISGGNPDINKHRKNIYEIIYESDADMDTEHGYRYGSEYGYCNAFGYLKI